ncbi:MAG: 30S ribosomal protein S7 [Candidatus Levybacteria bacterium]|nr:30S ribosomal protein S7 [Candidatus Levybacteria bacterium]
MPRGQKNIPKRKMEPDPIYGSTLLTKFINNVMEDGKKTIAQKNVYNALDIIKEKGMDPIATFEKALDTIAPKQEVRAKRVGGAAYQVPMEVRGVRKISLSIRWLLEAARKKPNSEFKTFSQKLAAEIISAVNNEGEAIRKRDSVHKMADANKAFAHFRF